MNNTFLTDLQALMQEHREHGTEDGEIVGAIAGTLYDLCLDKDMSLREFLRAVKNGYIAAIDE